MASNVQASAISTDGGLVLDRDPFSIPPGAAVILENYEPDADGGYSRIKGTLKYDSNELSNATISGAGSGAMLMTALFSTTGGTNMVLAGRGTIIAKSTGSGWTSVQTSRTSAEKYTFAKYNFNGTNKIIVADGANAAMSYDGSTATAITATGAPSDPESVEVFRNHIFFAGMASNKQEVVFAAPFAENDFTAANAAGSIKVDSPIVGLKTFRDKLIVFSTDEIYQITGTGIADFQMKPITRKLGCLDRGSIQEVGGDIIFLAPDGLRTVAGTEKIDDIELGTVSKAIQKRINEINFENISSLVIREKSQYRLFYPEDDQVETSAEGIIGTLKRNLEGNVGFQWADIKGVKPACTDSMYFGTTEYIIHGDYDGYVYRQEQTNRFNGDASDSTSGTAIEAAYKSPDITFGDAGVRKSMQRILLNVESEGDLDFSLYMRYNYNNSDTPQPSAISISETSGVAVFGNALSTFSTAVFGSFGSPLIRKSVEGSGFSSAVHIIDTASKAPYSVRGFQLEYTPGGRY